MGLFGEVKARLVKSTLARPLSDLAWPQMQAILMLKACYKSQHLQQPGRDG